MYDNAPIGNTCGDIDNAKSIIEDARSNADNTFDTIDEYESALSHIYQLLSDPLDLLEDLRTDNQTLRDWGNEMYDEKDQLEIDKCCELEEKQDDINSLRSQRDVLDGDIENLHDDIATLQLRVKELEEQITGMTDRMEQLDEDLGNC